MPLLSVIELGNYFSPLRLVIFIALAMAWLPLVSWIYADAKSLKLRESFWAGIAFGAGAFAIVLWLIMPIYIVGAIFFFVAVTAVAIAYVTHRDTRVMAGERILSIDRIKSLLENKDKKAAQLSKGLVYITANKNEVPLPEPKTSEFYGFKAANSIFEDAIFRRTNEILLLPTPQNYNLAYRIDGVACKQPPRTREEIEHLIGFLKQLADLDTSEKRKPQKGRFTIHKQKESFQWEVTTAGSTAGEQARIMLIESQNIMKLDQLGLNPDQLEGLLKVRDIPGKIFIVSGPKKSGVSTTFYAFLKNHDPFLNSIVTLEKQPSAELTNVAQNTFALTETGTTTFSKRLQTLLRTGPDIVGIADVEDPQTAALLLTAATKTGIHIYITIEADNAMQALGKWLKLANNTSLAADTFAGVCNQRLIRKLCPECKQAYEPNKDLLKKFNIPPEKVKTLFRAGEPQVDKKGRPILCPKCQSTGFHGRMATFESIVATDDIRAAIKQAKSLQEIATAMRRARMLFLQEQALRKVVDGTTAISELIREFSPAAEKPPAAAPTQPAAKA